MPGTSLTAEEALFLPGHTAKIPIDPDKEWYVCGRREALAGVGYVGTILGQPDMFIQARSRPCNVAIVDDLPATPDAGARIIKGPGCAWSLASGGGEIERVALIARPSVPPQVERCLFRLGLFMVGVQGALQIADDRLFVDSGQSPWSRFPRVPKSVPTIYFLLEKCGVRARSIDKISRLSDIRCK